MEASDSPQPKATECCIEVELWVAGTDALGYQISNFLSGCDRSGSLQHLSVTGRQTFLALSSFRDVYACPERRLKCATPGPAYSEHRYRWTSTVKGRLQIAS